MQPVQGTAILAPGMAGETHYSDDVARIYDLLVEGCEDAVCEGEELEFMLWALRDVCPREVRDVLDLGCGTGRHLVPLAREGYAVTGTDGSEGMVDECRRKLDRHGLSAKLRTESLQDLADDAGFDAVLCMNSVICYLRETDAILDALRRMWRALRPGGLALVDNCNFLAQWMTFGETYSHSRTSDLRSIEFEERRSYDDFTSMFHIALSAMVTEGERTYEIANEDALRVMTAGEMTAYLQQAGFTGIAAYPGFDLDRMDDHCGERMVFLAVRQDGKG